MSKILSLLKDLGIAIAKALSERQPYQPVSGDYVERLKALPYDVLGMICLYCEARGESREARKGVAHVILNRVQSDGFPDASNEVIMQKNQFSALIPGDPNYTLAISLKDTYEAWMGAVLGKDNTGKAISYHDDSIEKPVSKYWDSLKECKRIGRLIFYRPR